MDDSGFGPCAGGGKLGFSLKPETRELPVSVDPRLGVPLRHETIKSLREHFSPAEILELGFLIGQYLGFDRLLVALGVHEYSAVPYVAGLG